MKRFTSLAWLFCFAFLVPSSSFAADETSAAGDTFDIRDASFLLPQALPPGKYSSSLFLYNIFVPKDWTLDMIKAPMLCYAGKYTFSHGFNVQASLATLFVSTRVSAGPFWNYSHDRLHFGAGYQVAYNYGVLKQFGFHTVLTGWEQQPSLSVGYSFQTMALTLRSDLYWTNALYLKEGDNTIPFTNSFVNGYSFTLSLEQRLWANRVFSFGFKLSYLRYHILAWPAFPVNSYHYGVPEVQFGLNF